MKNSISPGWILNEAQVVRGLRSRALFPGDLFDRYADAIRAGRKYEFLGKLTPQEYDALVASLQGEKE